MSEDVGKKNLLFSGLIIVSILLAISILRLIISVNRNFVETGTHGLGGMGALSTIPILLLSGLLVILMILFNYETDESEDIGIDGQSWLRNSVVIVFSFIIGFIVKPYFGFELSFLPVRLIGLLVFLIPILLMIMIISTYLKSNK